MNSEFELIRYNDNLPARIEIKQGEINTPYHWHKEIELVYVLDGALEINVNNTAQTLHTDEFRLINSVENHSLSADNAKCLILDISYEFAAQFDESLYSSVFKVISGSGAEEELHNLLWQLSRTVNESNLPDLRQYSLITEILHVLFVQCRHENPNAVKEGENIQAVLYDNKYITIITGCCRKDVVVFGQRKSFSKHLTKITSYKNKLTPNTIDAATS